MKKVKANKNDELRPEYDLKSLRVRKLGPGRKSFGTTIPKGFRGLLWEPSSEQEVVMLFGQLLDHLPRQIAIDFVQTAFPDCKAVDLATGEPIWIEFELYSSHYRRDHLGRPEKCDWIVCWHNNLDSESWSGLPEIVALDKIVDSLDQLHIVNRRPPGATQEEYFRSRILGLSTQHQEIIQRLLEFANKHGFRIEWPETNGACFTVRDEIEYFKVNSNGNIGIPFSRWRGVVGSDVIVQLTQELNEALDTKWFTGRGKGSRDIVDLMTGHDAIQRFINIWQKFAAERRAIPG